MSAVATALLHATVVEIGGTRIRLLTDDPSFHRLIQNLYSRFVSSDSQASIELEVDLILEGTISREEDVRVERNGSRWSAERAGLRLDWNAEDGRGRVRQYFNPYALDCALRILHTLVLAHSGGFLLHAASAIRNGRASFFFGPSGSGKTTLARLAPPDATLLSDEMSYLRSDGEEYIAYGTPFAGRDLGRSGENVSAPVAALYHLVQAPANRILPLKPAEAARLLLESVLFFAEDPQCVKLVFQSVCDLVSRVPVYRLEFLPNESVWELIQ